MSMIQPRNQRHHVLDVDCKLEISQCLIYKASYSLQVLLPTLFHLLSELHDMNRRSVNKPHLENKGCEGQGSLGSSFNFHSKKKVPGLESNAWPSNSAFSPEVCVPTLSDCQTFPQIPEEALSFSVRPFFRNPSKHCSAKC